MRLPWSRICRLSVHQKLNISFVIGVCLSVGILLNVILNDGLVMSSHVLSLQSYFFHKYASSLGL
jgi:hypothetical protein